MAAVCSGGDEVNALVIDIGAYQCKAGYAGEDTPRAVFGTAIGEIPEQYKGGHVPMDVDPPVTNADVKTEVIKPWKKRGLRALNHPHLQLPESMEVLQTVTNGVTSDWDLWDTIVEEALVTRMRCNTVEHPLLCAEAPFLSKDSREKMVEHLFENFSSPAVFLAKNPVLSSFALGRQTSLVVDMGHSGTVVSAVHDGYALNNSILQSPVGGKLLTEALQRALVAKGANLRPWYEYRSIGTHGDGGRKSVTSHSANSWATEYLVADIKESLCRVNEVHFVEEENQNMPVQSYELPDGSSIEIGVERFKIPEILFDTSVTKTIPGLKPLVNMSGEAAQCIPEMVIESVNQTDVDLHKELLSGVILTGGGSLFMSTKERLDRELLDLAPQAAKVKVTVHQNATERKFSVWLGGSILGCLGSFHQLWLSKQEYAENGAALIHRRSP